MTKLFCLLLAILVQTQAEFERIPALVKEALSEGSREQIDVRLAPGVYFYDDLFLELKDVDAPEASLRLSGEDAVLVASDGGDRSYTLEKGYVDLNAMKPVDIRTEMRHARFWPLRVPFRKHLYRLRCREIPVPKDSLRDATLLLTQWYISTRYPIERITKRHIYFRRDKVYETGMLSELRYGRCFPRYMLCYPPKDSLLHPCSAVRFLHMEGVRLQSFALEGIHFLGNGDRNGDWLIRMQGVEAESLLVSGCRFEGIRSGGFWVERTDGILLQDNEFTKCYRTCIRIQDSCLEARIIGNRFIDNGYQISNGPVVNCKGGDFLISDNYFEDFSYSAIGLGHHYCVESEGGLSGIVERNEICMSEAFRSTVPRMLIDSGAIYVWTRNNGLIIRNNYIHDIAGPHGNRGILCDDGTCNVHIYGNRVVRVEGTFCIDLRMFRRVGWMKGSRVHDPNTGNVMYGNIIDGRCRFRIRRSDPTSHKGANIKL